MLVTFMIKITIIIVTITIVKNTEILAKQNWKV